MCVSPKKFIEHLQVLQSYSCRPLGQIGERKRSAITIAVTFDDGYADNLSNALPALERFEIPATFFITTGGIENRREFWWDELEQLILGNSLPSQIAFPVGNSVYRWDLESAEAVGPPGDPGTWWTTGDTVSLQLYRSVYHILQAMEEEARAVAMQTIAEACAKSPQQRESHRRLNWDEVAQLSRHGLAEIGAHTVTHPKLSACNRDEQYFEIKHSKVDLEERLGRSVYSFAYPYGGADHINQASFELVRQAGFSVACTTQQTAVYSRDNCFRLPRTCVPDLNGDEFEKLLTTALS